MTRPDALSGLKRTNLQAITQWLAALLDAGERACSLHTPFPEQVLE
jgi:hypothetical protein